MEIVLSYILAGLLVYVFFLIFFKLIRICPEQEAFIVERFGKYQKTLQAGLHFLIPFIDRIAYKHKLKEEVIDVEPQICITKDNVQVHVDGILYVKVMDPKKASYGIDDYRFATRQLAKTTMRSEIGKITLDKTFSERDTINDSIVRAVDEASDPWGIKVTRYEIRDISPPPALLTAMEQQMRAERDKRAEVLKSEGEKEARINISKGEREESINISKGEKQKRINESAGNAQAIQIIANATAEGISKIAEALSRPKGKEAMSLKLAEGFISQLENILSTAETDVLPVELAQVKSMFQQFFPGNAQSSLAAGETVTMTIPRPEHKAPVNKGGK